MKRFLSFFSAMFIFIASFYIYIIPTYAEDTSIIPIEDLDDDTFDIVVQPYDDTGLYDRDSWINRFVESIGANMVALGSEYPVLDAFFEGAPPLNVLYGTAKLKWLFQNVGIDTSTGEIVSLGDDMTTDALDEYMDSVLKTSGASSGTQVTIGSGQWLVGVPINYSTSSPSSTTWTDTNLSDVYSTWAGDKYLVICTTGSSGRIYVGSVDNNYVNVSTAYTGSETSGYYGSYRRSYGTGTSIAGFTSAQYSTVNAAVADFFGSVIPSAEPVWNGKGYYDDSRQFNINIPALPSVNWSNVSHKYYNDYGESYTDSSTVNNFYYNISNNYAPYEITYDVPYWLINGSDLVYTFSDPISDYDLSTIELADNELPSSYDMGWYQDIWDSLPSDVIALFGIILASTIGVGLLKS